MKKKYKILVTSSDSTGCGFYRSNSPHEFIAKKYPDEFEIDFSLHWPDMKGKPLDEFIKQYDFIHFHKCLDPYGNILSMCKFLDVPTMCDVDDNFYLGDFHPLSQTAKREHWERPIIRSLELSDYCSTPTPIFTDYISNHNKNGFVFPNAMNPEDKQYQITKQPSTSGKIRFGIICGSSHLHDLLLLKGLTNRLPKEILDKVQFVLCGFDTNGTRTMYNAQTGEQTVVPIQPEESVWVDYEKIITDNYNICSPKYKEHLQKYIKDLNYDDEDNECYVRRWTKHISEYYKHYEYVDVLLIPLRVNNFNKMKSNLKYAECGFSHTAVIASEFGPYTIDSKNAILPGGQIDPTGNCLLIPPGQDKLWAKYITMLVEKPELLKQLQDNMWETVKNDYSISKVCADRVEVYRKIIDENRQKTYNF
jgi:glycosyltransferase involved in cell wall biosynthesis